MQLSLANSYTEIGKGKSNMDFPGEEIRMDLNLVATLVCLPALMTTPLPGPVLGILVKLLT